MGFPEKNITLLVDSDAKKRPNKKNIESYLKKFTSELPENSLVIFSFAGHGLELKDKGACFLPVDCNFPSSNLITSTDPNDVAERTRAMDQLEASVVLAKDVISWLENSKANVKLMLVDACRNEFKRGTTNLRGFSMENTKGIAFLQSCSLNESSHESPQIKHGYFTLTFLDALDGKADANRDGIVTLSEIFEYTSRETKARVKKEQYSSQQPNYSYKGTTNNGVTIQDFPFVTGLLVDGLTKEQRDEAEKLYEEADKAFTDGNYKVAQEKINEAVEIYASNPKYKKLKDTIKKMVDVLDAQKKAEAEQQRLAEEKRKAEEQARLENQRPTTPSISSTPSGSKAGERLVRIVNGVEFAFRWCPAGTFTMGSPESEQGRYDDETQHKVTLTKGFWMMETEVTQKQWKAVMGTSIQEQAKKMLTDDTEYNFGTLGTKTIREALGFKRDQNPNEVLCGVGDDYPMYYISWNDCQEFCQKCTRLGLLVCLPTEAQWEYACRAGTKTSLYNGEIEIKGANNAPMLDPIAWYGGNSMQDFNSTSAWNSKDWSETQYPGGPCGTHPVGKKTENAWGLYDMIGNVWELCEDWYTEAHDGDSLDPVGPSNGSNRVFRGGGWYNDAQDCRSAYRSYDSPEFRLYYLGGRLRLKGQ